MCMDSFLISLFLRDEIVNVVRLRSFSVHYVDHELLFIASDYGIRF